MHFIQFFLLAATAFIPFVAALPATSTQPAASSTKTCNPIKTFTAKVRSFLLPPSSPTSIQQQTDLPQFDALAPSATPTPGYANVDTWSGFTVATSYSSYLINATSGHNVAVLPTESASMTLGIGTISSFSFACVATFYTNEFVTYPSACTIQLIFVPVEYAASLEVRTFGYDPGEWQSAGSANMTRVSTGVGGEAMYKVWWGIVEGAAYSQILVDNLVTEVQVGCPAGS